MASDATYQPLVYMKQNSTELVVASSGLLTVEGEISIDSGGALDVASGGGIDIESGGDITVESGGKIIFPVSGATSSASGSTTLTTLAADGLSFITSSGDVRLIYLRAPYPGASKYIVISDGTTGAVIYLDAKTAGAYFSESTAANSTRGLLVWDGTTNDAPCARVHLVGYSTTKWFVMEKSPATGFTYADTSS